VVPGKVYIRADPSVPLKLSWTVLGLYNGGKRKAGRKEENEGKKKHEL